MFVYKVTSPSGKVYIGMTKYSLEIRKSKHYRTAESGSMTKFYKAIRKYGENLHWEILRVCDSWAQAKVLEIEEINNHDSFKNGYNSTLGGDGQLGAAPMLGKKHSRETLEKMSRIKLGKIMTQKSRLKMSKAKKGISQNPSHVEACLKSRGIKPFLVFGSNGILIGEFLNQSECARILNLNQSLISGCLTTPNKNKSHKGYTFKYKD